MRTRKRKELQRKFNQRRAAILSAGIRRVDRGYRMGWLASNVSSSLCACCSRVRYGASLYAHRPLRRQHIEVERGMILPMRKRKENRLGNEEAPKPKDRNTQANTEERRRGHRSREIWPVAAAAAAASIVGFVKRLNLEISALFPHSLFCRFALPRLNADSIYLHVEKGCPESLRGSHSILLETLRQSRAGRRKPSAFR